ncbi:hypothetical protein HME9302_00579 [Alteripontixanthobacter maritimus]|uniref:DUF4365 domain-containing protein n=1 Tax=Alteripontixanthobacter maritimus TaxID=2161824 RepID=A0A369Q3C9_9SPHN|nr:hypothetical protein [Alteripontixanthobacter maritimus]RDC59391.1 hypothetical protein HME9302_00579 [Alteripontixanthobacter maritimus]
MPQRIGQFGERYFAQLVASFPGGASCNPSIEDNKGWDHVVEFDEGDNLAASADLRRDLPAIFVQTKTTTKSDRAVARISLSNALRMTRSLDPFFIVHITMRDGLEPVVRLRHWWADEMTLILEKVRTLSVRGVDEDDFARRTVTIALTEDERIEPEQLIATLRRSLTDRGKDYASVKHGLLETLGYQTDRFVGDVRIGPLDSVWTLLNHQLGLTPSIPLESVRLADRRFGVDVPLPIPDWPIAHASMHASPVAACRVRARGPDGSVLTVNGEVFSASAGKGERDPWAFRIRTPVFELVHRSDGQSSFVSNFDGSQRFRLSDLEGKIRILSWQDQGPIDFTVTVEDKRIFGFTGSVGSGLDTALPPELVQRVRFLATLTCDLESQPLVSLADINESEDLHLLEAVLAASDASVQAELHEGTKIDSQVDQAVGFAVSTVGDFKFAVLLAFPVERLTLGEDACELSLGKATVLHSYIDPASSPQMNELLVDDFRREATGIGKIGLGNLLFGLRQSS